MIIIVIQFNPCGSFVLMTVNEHLFRLKLILTLTSHQWTHWIWTTVRLEITIYDPWMKAALNNIYRTFTTREKRESWTQTTSWPSKISSLSVMKPLWELFVCFLVSVQLLVSVVSVCSAATAARPLSSSSRCSWRRSEVTGSCLSSPLCLQHPVSYTDLLFIQLSIRAKMIQREVWITSDIMEMFRRHLHVEQLERKIKHRTVIIIK